MTDPFGSDDKPFGLEPDPMSASEWAIVLGLIAFVLFCIAGTVWSLSMVLGVTQ